MDYDTNPEHVARGTALSASPSGEEETDNSQEPPNTINISNQLHNFL